MMDEQNVAAFDLLTILRRQNAFCIIDLPPAPGCWLVTTSTTLFDSGIPNLKPHHWHPGGG